MQRAAQKSPKRKTRQENGVVVPLGDGGAQMQQGLAKLTLTVMEMLRELMERQAIRRVDSGTLTDEQVERVGLAFKHLDKEMASLTKRLGMRPEEVGDTLSVMLRGPNAASGKASLVDLLDRLLERGAVVAGNVKVSVSDVDLVGIDLLAMLYPIYGERRWLDDWTVIAHE